MTAVSLSSCAVGADFREAPGNARRAWASRDGVLVRAEAEGRVGWGEASPLPGASLERLDDVREALEALGSLALDLGQPFASLAPALSALPLPPAARFGLETAVFDLCAQRCGVPLARWLTPAAASQSAVQVLVDRLVPEAIERALADGATTVKVKIGRREQSSDEIELLRTLRARAPGLVIRADANGSPITPELARALVEVGCALLEDPGSPVPGVPIALDGPLLEDPEGALERFAAGEAVAAVIKPTLLGGIVRTLGLVDAIRQRAPSTSIVVSHALESPVGLAAAAHVALAVGEATHGLSPWNELDRFEAEGRRIAVPDWIGRARLKLPASSGLGAWV